MSNPHISLEDFFEFSEPGFIRLKGHRIGIEDVIGLYRDGYTPERISRTFTGLGLELVYATITYYLIHRADMDSYIAQGERESEQAYCEWAAAPSPAIKRLREEGIRQAGQRP